VRVGHLAVDDLEEAPVNRRRDGPAPPAPTTILSIDRIGVISTAVPTKNASSAR
jgi:hypothetical protein